MNIEKVLGLINLPSTSQTIWSYGFILNQSVKMFLNTALESANDFNKKAYSIAIQIGKYTGLRVSEVFALEKEDINFNENCINVNRKLVYDGLKKDEIYSTHQMKSKSSTFTA